MQKLILTLTAIFSISGWADEPLTRFVCATRHLTTTYVLTEKTEKFELSVAHHMGLDYMPLHEGIITISDLKILSENAEIFRKLGEGYRISFAKDQCVLRSGEWTCAKSTPEQIGTLAVKNVFFRVSRQRTITSRIDYESFRARFSFTVANRGYTIPMEYATDECAFYEPQNYWETR